MYYICINKYIRKELDEEIRKVGLEGRSEYLYNLKKGDSELKAFTNGIKMVHSHDFKSFSIVFSIHGEHRRLFITHTCSSDNSEIYEGEKIIFDLGCHGHSKEIMKVVIEAVRDFGDVYYTPNDAEQEYKKI